VSWLSIAERLAAIDRSVVTFDPGRCLHSFHRGSICNECITLCPVGAIESGQPPSLDSDACTSCLACLPVCPTGAFSADDTFVSLLTFVARSDAKWIDIVCDGHPNGEIGPSGSEFGIRIRGCLAGLGVGTYISLIALDMEHIDVRLDACKECPWRDLHHRIKITVAQSTALLSSWDKANSVRVVYGSDGELFNERPLWDADNPPLSRRDLFRMASRQVQIAAARSMTKAKVSDARRPSRERIRIMQALNRLPERCSRGFTPPDSLGFTSLYISDDCTACGVCARACPTGALRFERRAGPTFHLAYIPQECIGCNICAQTCLPQAISLNIRPTFNDVFSVKNTISLSEGNLTRCQKCNSLFVARTISNLCPLCEYRRKNPFGSKLPPGFKGKDRTDPGAKNR
jgi:ferredoxin